MRHIKQNLFFQLRRRTQQQIILWSFLNNKHMNRKKIKQCAYTQKSTGLTVQDSNVFKQPPSQRHSGVHLSEFLKHLQFHLQAFRQEQWRSIEHAELTSFRVVQNGIQIFSRSFHSHPYSFGLGRLISLLRHLPQIKEETRRVLLTCWKSAACVGGIRSRDISFCVNMWRLASLIVLMELSLLYNRTVNFSRICIWAETSLNIWGFVVSSTIVSVTALSFVHAFHAVFLPMSLKLDVRSEPVYAWKKRIALHTCGESCWQIWWIGRTEKCFPFPYPTHSSRSPWSLGKKWIQSTTMSESTVLT